MAPVSDASRNDIVVVVVGGGDDGKSSPREDPADDRGVPEVELVLVAVERAGDGGRANIVCE